MTGTGGYAARPDHPVQLPDHRLRARPRLRGNHELALFGFSEQYRFVSEDQATRVSMTATAEPHGVFRLLAPIMTAGIRRQVRADHRRLKALLEHPGTGPAGNGAA